MCHTVKLGSLDQMIFSVRVNVNRQCSDLISEWCEPEMWSLAESSGMLGSLACAHCIVSGRQYIQQRKAVSMIRLSCASDWE